MNPKGSTLMPVIEPIIARALAIEVDRVTDDLSYQSISEWSSLGHVALMVELERHLGVTIGEDTFLELRSVPAIREFAQAGPPDERSTTAESPAPPAKAGSSVTVHRGLENVYFDRSTITRIDGEEGALEYRGYSIHDLAEHASFEETAWLLLHGDLPDAGQLREFRDQLHADSELPDSVLALLRTMADAHPMEALRTAVSALGATHSTGRDESTEDAARAAVRLIAQIPVLIAAHHAVRTGRELPRPAQDASHATRFLHLLRGEQPSPTESRFVDTELVVHADHGSNASAFAARVAKSCGSNMHAAVTAAIATFSGPLHGGAAERVIDLVDAVGHPDNARAYVRDRFARNLPVMGFGHRVYRTEDPRVRHLRAMAAELSRQRGDSRGYDIVLAVVEAMKPYARHGIEPNVDLYAGLLYRSLGLPDDLAVPMFVAGRIAGWAAQALEQQRNNVLIRPLLDYVGPSGRRYLPGRAA